MSADAKLWQVDADGWRWAARHDGHACLLNGHNGIDCGHPPMLLLDAMTRVEQCLGQSLRWKWNETVLAGRCA